MACALAGCGRKAGLDLPPSSSSYQATPGVLDDTSAGPPEAATSQGDLYSGGTNSVDKGPIAPKGPKKRIILDPILD
ncbi:MAG: hypothetical protein HY242_10820 [Afipia sp.]|nr:hypothetical protein [Afipia sp.]